MRRRGGAVPSTPRKVSTPASVASRVRIVTGVAPTERRIAISRRRSLSVVRIMVTMPRSAVSTTMPETAGERGLGGADEPPKLLKRRTRKDRG